jgi:hypothetical protein
VNPRCTTEYELTAPKIGNAKTTCPVPPLGYSLVKSRGGSLSSRSPSLTGGREIPVLWLRAALVWSTLPTGTVYIQEDDREKKSGWLKIENYAKYKVIKTGCTLIISARNDGGWDLAERLEHKIIKWKNGK